MSSAPPGIYVGFRHPVTRAPTNPLPAQAAAFASQAKHLGLFGGYGSGKSTTLGLWCLDEALAYSNNLGVIARKTWNDLRDSTMEVFWREVLPDEMAPGKGSKKDPYRCRWMATDRDLIFYNGSKIMFRHMADPPRYRSMELGFFGLDEGIEDGMHEAFKVMSSRLRRENSSRRSITVSNPGPKSCWLHRTFVEGMKRKPNTYFAVSAPSIENRYLPEDYLAELMDYPDEEFQMFVMGEFIAAQGAIFPKFRRERHVIRPFVIPDEWPKVRCVDVGVAHPFACLWLAVDESRPAIYVYREWVVADLDIEQQCRAVHGLSVGEQYLHTVIDPTTAARAITGGMPVIDQVRMYLDNVVPGFNDVQAGITRIRTLLNWNVDGAGHTTREPMLYFFESCPVSIDQIESLQYDVRRGISTGKPVKRDDDTVDALKYGVQSLGGIEGLQYDQAPKRDTLQLQCLKQVQAVQRRRCLGRGRRSLTQAVVEQALGMVR